MRVTCSIPRPVYKELVAQEAREGVYRCRIIASLIGAVVDRENRLSHLSRVGWLREELSKLGSGLSTLCVTETFL